MVTEYCSTAEDDANHTLFVFIKFFDEKETMKQQDGVPIIADNMTSEMLRNEKN